MKFKCLLVFFAISLLFSCSDNKKKKLAFYDSMVTSDSLTMETEEVDCEIFDNSDEIYIPFEEHNGVKYIDVSVNGQFTVKMILDSGCSGTLISIAEAKYLYEKGCITSDDILGIAQSQIADGSIVENMVVNLREITLGNKITCTDVKATVSSNANAPLLLGNEVLNRVPAYSVDNENNIIIFKLKQ